MAVPVDQDMAQGRENVSSAILEVLSCTELYLNVDVNWLNMSMSSNLSVEECSLLKERRNTTLSKASCISFMSLIRYSSKARLY